MKGEVGTNESLQYPTIITLRLDYYTGKSSSSKGYVHHAIITEYQGSEQDLMGKGFSSFILRNMSMKLVFFF